AWFLPRIIGQAAASEMLFTAEPFDADRALLTGLVGEVLTPDDLLPRAKLLASKIANNAPLAVRETKKLLRKAVFQPLEDHLKDCAAAQGRLHVSDDHMEALDAFFEKRAGQFQFK
ncbi:MAG: enoyl-CoA hydratase-related protein, partial [Alphaproteobacteria bacterium]|nr:enoyl-CoA hydratase-related protein [Alphaproteobacteria bacterium]